MEYAPPVVLSIDAGSGSCRALLFDAEGALLGLAQREWTYHPVPDAPGGFDFDTVDGWRQVSACIQEVLARTGVPVTDIAAVSAASTTHPCSGVSTAMEIRGVGITP